jgi:hypothetical protein
VQFDIASRWKRPNWPSTFNLKFGFDRSGARYVMSLNGLGYVAIC